MEGFRKKKLADRAGVDPDYVDRLIELGILTPGEGDTFSLGDVRRVRLVESLEAAGLPLDGMGWAVGSGHLSFAFVDNAQLDRFSGFSGKTFREVSAETGIPMELLQAVRESIGFALPNSDDLIRDDELGSCLRSSCISHGVSRRRSSSGGYESTERAFAGSSKPTLTGTAITS